MTPFPFFNVPFFLFNLVLPIGKDVQEFNCTPSQYLLPGASAGLGGCIYIGDPSPLVCKSLSCSWICLSIFSLCSLSGIFRASCLE